MGNHWKRAQENEKPMASVNVFVALVEASDSGIITLVGLDQNHEKNLVINCH